MIGIRMGITLNRLTVKQIENLSDGMHADGGNLWLQVSNNGAGTSWIFRYDFNGKRKKIGLGSLTRISLANARKLAQPLREELGMKRDPQLTIQSRRAEQVKASASAVSFKDVAEMCIEAKRSEWKSTKHAQQWHNTLTQYVYPQIGKLNASDITTDLILRVLEPIWLTKSETASRIRQRIETVLDYATVKKYRQGENPARWKGHLSHLLAAPRKIKKVEHQPSLDYKEIFEFVRELVKRNGYAARCLEFIILTAVRSGEARNATWSEIDLDNKVWIIPEERMKGGKPHFVPLSPPAVSMLRGLHKIEGSEFVFPGQAPRKPLSDVAVTHVVRRLGYAEPTVHGFRSTFRVWAAENSSLPSQVAEFALAHKLPDQVEASYQRSTLLPQRAELMDAWANYCLKNLSV